MKPGRDTILLLGIAAAKIAVNVAFLGRYGFFRDELYYIACSDHLAWGYVDHPPLSIFLLAAVRRTLGDSLFALRILAVLAGAATVVLTGLMARKLGGGRFSQLLAATAAAASPVVLGNAGRFYSMNAFDLLLWAWAAYLLIAIVVEGREKLWLAYGLVAGLGLMNKYSMLFFGLGTVAGLLATARRRDLLRPWIWLGGAIAVAIVLPHAVWEIGHGFPTAEFIHNATVEKNAPLSVGEFLASQPMMTGFGQTLLFLLGLGLFWVRGRAGSLRLFAWMYPVVAVVMILGNSKAYYLTPIYAPYWAAGAIAVEGFARSPGRSWSKHAVIAALLLFGLVSLPFAVPALPVDEFVRYQAALGQRPKAEERSSLGDLPQYYADMFGWEEMVAQVASIYRGLSADEQRHCVIYARNYGEAAAIDFFGKRYGLPGAVCPHNSYWYWGTGVEPMRVAIVFGHDASLEENLADLRGPGRFESVELAATTSCEHCMPFENHRAIFLCRGPQFTLREIWRGERAFI